MSICTQETIASASAFPLLPFWMSGSGPENPEWSPSRHKRTRFWAVRLADGELICVCVYKHGALEVARRLEADFSFCLRDAPTFGEIASPGDEPRRYP